MTAIAVAPTSTQATVSNGRRAHRPAFTVIVPRKHQAGNIEPLHRRVEDAVGDNATEVIFVGDSADETPAVISHIAAARALAVRVQLRPPARRAGRAARTGHAAL